MRGVVHHLVHHLPARSWLSGQQATVQKDKIDENNSIRILKNERVKLRYFVLARCSAVNRFPNRKSLPSPASLVFVPVYFGSLILVLQNRRGNVSVLHDFVSTLMPVRHNGCACSFCGIATTSGHRRNNQPVGFDDGHRYLLLGRGLDLREFRAGRCTDLRDAGDWLI